MSVTLSCAWVPRGELVRLQRLIAPLRAIYQEIVVSVHADGGAEVADALMELHIPHIVYDNWSGRHATLKLALEKTESTHIHYVDMDRALRWMELHPDELATTAQAIQKTDCLILGRTEAALASHPQVLIQTEKLVNLFFSHIFGRESDFCAGSKGFSRAAAEFILTYDADARALNMDVGWAVLLQRGGFKIDYLAVDGLDYESADQFQAQASDSEVQQKVAEAYDAKAKSWAHRVRAATEITQAGLAAMDKNSATRNEL